MHRYFRIISITTITLLIAVLAACGRSMPRFDQPPPPSAWSFGVPNTREPVYTSDGTVVSQPTHTQETLGYQVATLNWVGFVSLIGLAIAVVCAATGMNGMIKRAAGALIVVGVSAWTAAALLSSLGVSIYFGIGIIAIAVALWWWYDRRQTKGHQPVTGRA